MIYKKSRYIEPRNWSKDVPNTGTYRNTLGIYDTSDTLWNYVMNSHIIMMYDIIQVLERLDTNAFIP